MAITASPAAAASTRAEYVAQVEPLCQSAQKPTFKAYFRFAKAFRKLGLNGEDIDVSKQTARRVNRLAGAFYTRISNIYGRTTSQIAGVAPAPGDEAAVASWLEGRNQAAALGLQAGRAAKHQKSRGATRLVFRAVSASEQAAGSVSTFGLKYCALPFGEATSE
jgi:hypothetical protein